MTAADKLARLEALAEAATPGPWGCDEQDRPEIAPLIIDEHGDPELDWTREVAAAVSSRADGLFIAAADPVTVGALVQIAKAAEAARVALGNAQTEMTHGLTANQTFIDRCILSAVNALDPALALFGGDAA